MNSSACFDLEGFPSAEGRHCSSTSVRKVLEYDGLRISEALAFGLGSGLGFFYLKSGGESPARVINGRAPDLEGSFYRHVGAPLAWAGQWAPAELAGCLKRGRPVLAQTDLFHLPYYQPPVHFPGHGIVVLGVDLDARTARIADQGFSEVQTTAIENLRLSMEMTAPPLLPSPYRWAPAPRIEKDALENPNAFTSALERSVAIMLGNPGGVQGLPAMGRFAAEIAGWRDLDDAFWCARFAYQSIKKRGTDGASFRYLYAAFLQEAEAFIPSLRASKASRHYEEAGRCWESLADRFKAVFVAEDRSLFGACAGEAEKLLAAESTALEALRTALGRTI